jgi:hypothetical protein
MILSCLFDHSAHKYTESAFGVERLREAAISNAPCPIEDCVMAEKVNRVESMISRASGASKLWSVPHSIYDILARS